VQDNWVLGVDWGHILDWQPIYDEKRCPVHNRWQVQWNTGMMGIVPIWKLMDLLNDEALKKHRAEVEAKHTKPKSD